MRVTADKLARYIIDNGYGHDITSIRTAHFYLFKELNNGKSPRFHLFLDTPLVYKTMEKLKNKN